MEKISFAGMHFHPGQIIAVTGVVGSGKTLMGKRFATAAIESGATPLVITRTEDVAMFRTMADVATTEQGARILLDRAQREHGHVVLILDHAELVEKLWPQVEAAADRHSVTVVHVKPSLNQQPALAATEAVVVTGVRMPVRSAKEAFDMAVGRGEPQHARWQCAVWRAVDDTYEVFDL